MSDVVQGMPADGITAGTLLRRAREAAGLHVGSLAATLKVPVRKLEALEEDRYDLLADAVFTRALASSVCRTLKIDPQPVLERLPHTGAPRLVQDKEGLNAPFRAAGDGPPANWIQQLAKPVPLTVGALLLGALVIVLLPGVQRDDAASTATTAAVMPPAATPTAGSAEPAPAPATEPTAAVTAAPATSMVTTTVAPNLVAAAPAAAPVHPTPAASPVAAVAPAASAPAASDVVQPASNGVIVFKAKGQSWVQVTDASGTMVLRRLMEPGETVGASGSLPLSVVVGSVKDTEVLVRGKPYNMRAVAGDNVARFEVK